MKFVYEQKVYTPVLSILQLDILLDVNSIAVFESVDEATNANLICMGSLEEFWIVIQNSSLLEKE